MSSPLPIIATLVLSLGLAEGLAYWWMHPAPSGHDEPVLVYQPGVRNQESKVESPKSKDKTQSQGQAKAPAPRSSSINNQKSTIPSQQSPPSSPPSSDLRPSTFDSSYYTQLPEIYSKAAPMLRCSSGQVFRIDLDDSLSLHCAFFEWDGTDTGSVLEAFRHMPEACMGSIGMKLVSKEKSILYQPGRDAFTQASEDTQPGRDAFTQASEDTQPLADRGQGAVAGHQVEENQGSAQIPSKSSIKNQKSKIPSQQSEVSPFSSLPHPKSKIQNSKLATHSLLFDHTIFRDPGQGGGPSLFNSTVHAFRAVWVSGLDKSDARSGLAGSEFDQLRAIRLDSAYNRFRPSHARVIQGAVRGAPNGEAAWQAFEQAMLKDLHFSTP